jgi:hypothetical protein
MVRTAAEASPFSLVNTFKSINSRVFSSMHIDRRFYWRILQKNILYSGFKTPYKKIRETKTLDSVHAQKPRLKLPFTDSISLFPLLFFYQRYLFRPFLSTNKKIFSLKSF